MIFRVVLGIEEHFHDGLDQFVRRLVPLPDEIHGIRAKGRIMLRAEDVENASRLGRVEPVGHVVG